MSVVSALLLAPDVRGTRDVADAPQEQSVPPVPVDSTVNDFMAWVAGTSQADSSLAYRRFAEASVRTYAELREGKLNAIKAFSDLTLSEARSARTVLYPFAGGDVAYITEFFPTADTIVLTGLEPVGRIFAWRDWTPRQRQSFLTNLNRAVSASNRIGYFLTNGMRADFADSSLNGVVHPIMMYLGWKGFEIVRLSHFSPSSPLTDVPASDSVVGLRLLARHATTGKELLVEYVSTDLSNEALQRDASMIRYLQRYDNPSLYLKAASYLLHHSNFSVIRSALSARAGAVVQDDTGFPLAVLVARFDSVAVYGSYTRPIELFKNRFQPDLKALFDRPGVQRLGFRITYGGGSNLQYATRPKS